VRQANQHSLIEKSNSLFRTQSLPHSCPVEKNASDAPNFSLYEASVLMPYNSSLQFQPVTTYDHPCFFFWHYLPCLLSFTPARSVALAA